MSLPKYQAYRDSGLPWLGEVPAHWDITRLRHCANVQTGIAKGKDNDGKQTVVVPYLRVANVQDGYLALSDVATIEVPPDVLSRYTLQYGDVLMNEGGDVDKLGRGCIWRDEIPDCIHQNHVFSVRPHAVSPEWLNLLTGSAYAQFYFMTRAKQSTNLASISSTNIMELPLVLPPKEEQAAITAFLDRETAKIDALVAEQEKLIALLAEKRQATISHAVTRGLNPDAPMKDSGVAWLSEVPAHWTLTPLGRVTKDRCDGPFGSGIKSEHYRDGGALVVRLQNIRSGFFNKGESVYLDEEYFLAELQGHNVHAGDVLVAGLGDDNNLLGRACVAPARLGPALVKADCFRFRLDAARASPEFVAWQLSAGAAHDAGVLATGTTRSRIPLGAMASRKVALPPVDEQSEIAQFIAQENSRLDALKFEADRAIGLLKERRSALIAAAVTGQIDVRRV
ncbi:restriction endonuclease subunit S [Paucibacter sp. DJ2R-2]|uniref:restriction endonuclease subunit S n=1 Tax=Paucibacter sp. DJ2R-2 TaxID=2893558 RepID=UPI0021E4EBC2|nr:restriction endonuclease subunit S [Paucibacter sp. DJ2R-2]MCV2438179.1 restriction endonuclease subunit S [Paucibacter sp. DJ2R-2]